MVEILSRSSVDAEKKAVSFLALKLRPAFCKGK